MNSNLDLKEKKERKKNYIHMYSEKFILNQYIYEFERKKKRTNKTLILKIDISLKKREINHMLLSLSPFCSSK